MTIEKMGRKKNPIVFLDVSIGDGPDERMIFEVHFLFLITLHASLGGIYEMAFCSQYVDEKFIFLAAVC